MSAYTLMPALPGIQLRCIKQLVRIRTSDTNTALSTGLS